MLFKNLCFIEFSRLIGFLSVYVFDIFFTYFFYWFSESAKIVMIIVMEFDICIHLCVCVFCFL